MYRKILVPVDLTHKEKLSKALDTAVDIPVCQPDPIHCLFGIT